MNSEEIEKRFEEWMNEPVESEMGTISSRRNTVTIEQELCNKFVWIAASLPLMERIDRMKSDYKKDMDRKDKEVSYLKNECSRLYEPTKQFWNNDYEEKITKLEAENKELKEMFKEEAQDNTKQFHKIEKLESDNAKMREVLEFTQRVDVVIGHTSDTEDNVLRGMPDKIMMRNRARECLAKIGEKI